MAQTAENSVVRWAAAKAFDAGTPTQEELQEIGRYARRALSAQEVYTFSILLCDNRVDRDFERFDTPALQRLAKLYLGKTGIFDHNPRSENQAARIFSARVVTDPSQPGAEGEPYAYLLARAYLLRTDKNRDLILEIDGGIKKEVSVSCAVARRVCSVCGGSGCDHQPGRWYEGRQCTFTLQEPTDVYEWSFVAVPAQPAAGVTKGYERSWEGPVEKLFEGEGATLSAAQCRAVQRRLAQLAEEAAAGAHYREKLAGEVLCLAATELPGLPREVAQAVVGRMTLPELESYRDCLRQKSEGAPAPQLWAGRQESCENFLI